MDTKTLFEKAIDNNMVVYDGFDWSGYPTKRLFELLRSVWYSQFNNKPESYIVSWSVKNGLWCFDRDLVGTIDSVFGFNLKSDDEIEYMGLEFKYSTLKVKKGDNIKENTMLITDFNDGIIGVY